MQTAAEAAAAWVPILISETEHYAVFNTPDYPATEGNAPLFLERLWSLGYRYIRGDMLIVCEKMKVGAGQKSSD